jgi:hypothetical protein
MCATNIMKVYFKNEKKPICIEIFIHSLKYINIFLILYTKCARKFSYVLQCAANRKSLRTTGIDIWRSEEETSVSKHVVQSVINGERIDAL